MNSTGVVVIRRNYPSIQRAVSTSLLIKDEEESCRRLYSYEYLGHLPQLTSHEAAVLEKCIEKGTKEASRIIAKRAAKVRELREAHIERLKEAQRLVRKVGNDRYDRRALWLEYEKKRQKKRRKLGSFYSRSVRKARQSWTTTGRSSRA